jgi:hypothetical protein
MEPSGPESPEVRSRRLELLRLEHGDQEVKEKPHGNDPHHDLEHGSLPSQDRDEKSARQKGTHHDAHVEEVRHAVPQAPFCLMECKRRANRRDLDS